MSSMPKREIRMPESLWERAGEVAQQLFPSDERGERSSLVRDAVADAVGDWLYSPYVAENVLNLVYVNRFGDAFYSSRARLRFNADCTRLPCFVDQKVEKQHDYENDYQDLGKGQDKSQWLRKRWLFNYSALYENEQEETPIVADSDSLGLVQKSVALTSNAVEGQSLVREVTTGLLDYSQWRNSGRHEGRGDRAALPIDIPMRSLEFIAIVDADLYQNLGPVRNIPALRLEIRNRESVAFADSKMGEYLALSSSTMDKQQAKVIGGRHSQSGLFAEVDGHLKSLRDRMARIAAYLEDLSGKPISEYSLGAVGELMYTPERFLFFRLGWLRPRTGLQVCVRWEKPNRPAVREYPLLAVQR